MQPKRPTKPDDPAPKGNRNWARPQEDPSANHPNRAAHKKTARERHKRYNRATARRGKPNSPCRLPTVYAHTPPPRKGSPL
jgi:hypothetical protein